MSRKLWVARVCVALGVFLLFVASSHAYDWWKKIHRITLLMHWEFFGISVFLEIIAGVLLGIPPEVFLNLRKVRFSPKEFIVLAIIPIIVLIYLVGDFARIWFIGWRALLVYIGLNTSPVWIGVAIGKALHIRGVK